MNRSRGSSPTGLQLGFRRNRTRGIGGNGSPVEPFFSVITGQHLAPLFCVLPAPGPCSNGVYRWRPSTPATSWSQNGKRSSSAPRTDVSADGFAVNQSPPPNGAPHLEQRTLELL